MKYIPEKFLWIVAFSLVALAYLSGLFIDLAGDSGLYAAISRQMVESGNWFDLRINGVPYDQKPHLFFWLAGLGIRLFGNTNFAFKLFPFIYGTFGIYFTYRLGKQLFSEEAGKWAALIAGTSQIFFLYFLDFHTDSVLQTGVVLALWQLAAYFQTTSWKNFVLAFMGVGLAMLAKGPIGAVLPFFTVLIYLIVKKDFRQLLHPKWLLGILIVFILISPSLLHLYKNFGINGLRFYFIGNNIGRITGEVAGSSNDYFFYIHTFLWAFLPWTPVIILALVKIGKSGLKYLTNKEYIGGMIGSVTIILLILSIAKGKAPNYFLIMVSPFSVLAGWWLSELFRMQEEKQKSFVLFYRFFAEFYVLFFAFVVWFFGNLSLFLSFLVILVGGFGLFFILKQKEEKLQKLIIFVLIVSSGLNLFLNAKVIPDMAAYQGARQVLKIYEEDKSLKKQLYNFEMEDYALFFYSKQTIQNIDNWDDLYRTMEKPGTWLYTNEIKYNDIIQMNYKIDTVYQIRQRGLNRINIEFLNPKTRERSLKTNYLIVSGGKNTE